MTEPTTESTCGSEPEGIENGPRYLIRGHAGLHENEEEFWADAHALAEEASSD
jgi:hypothetical protein